MALNIEFLNLNANRRYPVREDANIRATNVTDVVLPESLLLDFVFTVPQNELNGVKLTRVVLAGNTLMMIWKDDSDVQVTSLVVDLATHTAYNGYALAGSAEYLAGAGRVIIGDPSLIRRDMPDGAYEFNAPMEFTTLIPAIREVNSLTVDTAGQQSPALFGHVRLVAGSNIRLTPIPGNAIRIDAISGDGFEDDCDCDSLIDLPCVTAINGIPLTELNIDGDDCVEVTVRDGRLKIENPCAQPCCGCEELAAISDVVRQLQQTETQLRDYLKGLENRQVTLEQFLFTMVIPFFPESAEPTQCLAPGFIPGVAVTGDTLTAGGEIE